MREPDQSDKEEEMMQERFNKILTIFGDEVTSEWRNTVQKKLKREDTIHTANADMINIEKLKKVIGKLESHSNPASVLNRQDRKTMVARAFRKLDDLKLIKKGFISFSEYKELMEKTSDELNCEEKKIVKYLTTIEEGKKLFKWPPPWFTLSMTAIQLIFYIIIIIGNNDMKTNLRFHG
jgi:hypothetical protein